ncbi:MAG: hypothetical protein JWO33_2824, partial [Caulobacteraceae bacterium]|nr:hypothetical protein [Caulobacteraceae bacterium]
MNLAALHELRVLRQVWAMSGWVEAFLEMMAVERS